MRNGGGGISKLKTGMVEQLGRGVCNIWCYATRKKTRRGSKVIFYMLF